MLRPPHKSISKVWQQVLVILALSSCDALAFFKASKNHESEEAPSVLKADAIDGDRVTNVITATGNVEFAKGPSTAYSDVMSYDKNTKIVTATGHVKLKDVEVGNVFAKKAMVKDDFTSGTFLDSTIVFNDGSYLISPQIDRQTPEVTVLQKPIFSLCPNPDISKDNSLAGKLFDMLSIKAREATVDRQNNKMKMKHGILRIYNVPLLYTPYISTPLPNNKRRTGFLSPSYIKNSRFGIGLQTPFFVDLAPNYDLTISPLLYTRNDMLIVNNDFRHLTSKGFYEINLQVAQNKITAVNDKTVINRTKDQYRWSLDSKGKFVFNTKDSLNYKIQNVGDRNYLRDYNFNFLAYTLSDVSYDHTDGRQYFGVKAVRIQELVNPAVVKSAPTVFPVLNSYIESKPQKHNERFALGSNLTVINRDNGLAYRRASFSPEVKIPVNLHGNLFDFNGKVQTDFYSLENHFDQNNPTANYNTAFTNYRPEFSAKWRLPLIQKLKSNSLVIEPMANFVTSSFQKPYSYLPNEDSNNSELTVNNLFVNNRIAGYDRNEVGQRVSYGVKTSMFNKYGQTGLTLGQSYRITNPHQDVTIRGFNDNNKSNFVGEFYYRYNKYFYTLYSFQLNESNYRNDVNSVLTTLSFDRFSLNDNYLLLRKTNANLQTVEQNSIGATVKLSSKISVGGAMAEDLVLKRIISRSVNFSYTGCCIIFTFSATENNSSNLVKPQTSYKFNVVLNSL